MPTLPFHCGDETAEITLEEAEGKLYLTFLKSTGITFTTNDYPKELWLEAYRDAGRTIFKNICGCDYFISYNAYMGQGDELEKTDPDIKCNWIPPMFESLRQIDTLEEARELYGRYILFYFIFHGHYKQWVNQFSVDSVVGSVMRIVKETGCTPVFTGAVWDGESHVLSRVIKNIPNCIDLRGETTMEELFGLIKGSEMVVGYPSGLTIMSTVLRAKTLIIWNEYYNQNFVWNCCPPETRNKNYFVENTHGLTPGKLTGRVKEIIGG